MLGREVTTSLELVFPLPRVATEGPLLDPNVSLLEQDLQQAYALDREILKTTQKRMKKDYDLKAVGSTMKWEMHAYAAKVAAPYKAGVRGAGASGSLKEQELQPRKGHTPS
ncbi:hypothetical protein PoB_003601500 [Plakobranchus ocellatus]|uniref:Uncharacterized protein n=1 Tax=Plakobranchus ocellatus TaxID=259542 RepID=A0AAV4ARL6_9GAST|nr:hypothetical protein PoB_003601500 [Plakobranchus ocellatus]